MATDVLIMDNSRIWRSIVPTALEPAPTPIYADAADRDARAGAPAEGDMAFIRDPGHLQIYVNGAWQTTGAVFTTPE